MSLIKTIRQQLGLSVTPANNFTFDASADNGTMKLARESGQDIMTVDANGKVAFPQNAQAWQSPTRANATNYTNTTGNTIHLSLTVTSSNGSYLHLTVGGVVVATAQSNIASPSVAVQLSAPVPDGTTYRTDGSATITAWKELR